MIDSTFSLRDFLKLGTLGFIQLGMPRAEVENLLGIPESVYRFRIHKNQFGQIWRYEDLELSFVNEVIILIQLHTPRDGSFTLPKPLNMEGLIPSRFLTLEGFKQYLDKENIEYKLEAGLTFDTQTCVNVESRVLVCFDEEGYLAKLSCSGGMNES